MHSDFANLFYPAGKQALLGHLQYPIPLDYGPQARHIFPYPPAAALFLAPIAWLPLHAAVAAWWALGVVLMGVTATLMATSLTPRARGHRFMVGGAVFLLLASFAPLAATVGRQFDIVIVALVAAAFVASADRTRRKLVFASGVLLGLAASLKLYPLLTLAVIVVLRRSEARLLLAGAACAIASCLVIPALVVGTGSFREYAHVLSAQGSPNLTAYPYAFGFLNIAYRALVRTSYVAGAGHLDPGVVKAVFSLFVLCVLTFEIRRLWVVPAHGVVWASAVAVTAVCSPFLEFEHLPPLALILVMLAGTVGMSVAPLLVGCVVCGLLAEVVSPGFPLAFASMPIAAAVGLWLIRDHARGRRSAHDFQMAIFGSVFVLLASPAFLNVSASWPVPMSLAQVALGSAEYILVILIMLLMPSRSKTVSSGRPTLPHHASASSAPRSGAIS